MAVIPYKESTDSKKVQVEAMFDNISGKYDFLNHFLSFSLDKYWRRSAIELLKGDRPEMLLDVATGTGDMVKAALRLAPSKITGIDLSEGMLQVARKKKFPPSKNTLIEFVKGDSEDLPFPDQSYDAVTVAFGVRNFENPIKGLSEMLRVLRPGGKLVVLEFSKPVVFPFAQIYRFYFRYILPFFGKMLSKDKSAYSYLPESVSLFPEGNRFVDLLDEAGYRECHFRPLTFGVVTLYTGIK